MTATERKPAIGRYFLPYQAAWLNDASRLKIWEKSRRIGASYVQAFEDVRDAARAEGGLDVWFSSADQSAALEYIRYCGMWARVLDIGARDLGEVVLEDDDKDIKAFVVEFANGKRITGLSSNPKAFRSKGGKLVLDEYAFHKQPEELWKAALPVITWGYPCRVISTYNGKGNRYYRMVTAARKAIAEGKLDSKSRWSLHTTPITLAVEQGLADKILGRQLTQAERQAWLAEQREAAGDEETWQQEFMCMPVDEATAWLTWELIISAEHADAGRPDLYQGGEVYVGVDIGRRRDLFVIWVFERLGDVLWTREVIRLKNASFAAQDAALDNVFARYRVRRCCMDETGMGMKPVEDAQTRHGSGRVEGVTFTGPVKQHLATQIKQVYEDKRLRTPEDRTIRDSMHAVRKLMTVAGNPRFDADRSELGHADEFWAAALAVHAAEDRLQPAYGATIEDPQDDGFSMRRGSIFGSLSGRQQS
ncbi:MAG: terminase large subunit domain-containing protein [Rhodocyclaceae bacterium]